jgi:hypothetical protein
MLRIDEFVGLHINEGVDAIARHAALRDLERVGFYGDIVKITW